MKHVTCKFCGQKFALPEAATKYRLHIQWHEDRKQAAAVIDAYRESS